VLQDGEQITVLRAGETFDDLVAKDGITGPEPRDGFR
jgi:hypothetical protein